jgi:hypothetical protein
VHDNKSVAQSSNTNTPNPISNYLAVPGTGEVLAFGSTAGGTTNTHPGGQGSAIGLVNSGNLLQIQFTLRSVRPRDHGRAGEPVSLPVPLHGVRRHRSL